MPRRQKEHNTERHTGMPRAVRVPIVGLGLEERVDNETGARDKQTWDQVEQPAHLARVAGFATVALLALLVTDTQYTFSGEGSNLDSCIE